MADQGTLKALTITMTKHPSSFKLESPLREINDIVKANNSDAVALYEGPVRALCQLAPNNVNTMAGGAIAAHNLGFDGVIAKLVSDPKSVMLISLYALLLINLDTHDLNWSLFRLSNMSLLSYLFSNG
ncbi:hypothetical protein DICVIV_05578 [Dictyocaulus viviparus]|uniref:Aspartate dehydrogenase domain-containing protein n=1 Tax=Dictyocaulus viviparus TaxID=29172 RepID=A0A0D8XX01_DICVI|nr:hypothetical protein DICVIV_05578 [Dictyocaulus viviparus]